MVRVTAGIRRRSRTRWGLGIFMLAMLGLSAGPAFGQASNEITVVDPNSAEQGTTGLLVTFMLDTDSPLAPPAGVMPDSVMISSRSGTSVTHTTQYTITAVFDIPAGEPTGFKDATITFSPPEGTLTFSMADGFEVTAGGGHAAKHRPAPAVADRPSQRLRDLHGRGLRDCADELPMAEERR